MSATSPGRAGVLVGDVVTMSSAATSSGTSAHATTVTHCDSCVLVFSSVGLLCCNSCMVACWCRVFGWEAGRARGCHCGWLTFGACSCIVEMSDVGASGSRRHAGFARRLGGVIVPQRGISTLIRRRNVVVSIDVSLLGLRNPVEAFGADHRDNFRGES